MSDNLEDYELGALVAIQGKKGCTDSRCSRLNGRCHGYHCPKCGEPCSMMGHSACPDKEADHTEEPTTFCYRVEGILDAYHGSRVRVFDETYEIAADHPVEALEKLLHEVEWSLLDTVQGFSVTMLSEETKPPLPLDDNTATMMQREWLLQRTEDDQDSAASPSEETASEDENRPMSPDDFANARASDMRVPACRSAYEKYLASFPSEETRP